MDNFKVIILAAGKGTRMKSSLPKVMHKLNGRAMVDYVLDLVEELGCSQKIIVTGDGREMVEDLVAGRAECVYQSEQLGTGHAVLQAWDYFSEFHGNVVVVYGDTPLLTAGIVKEFLEDFSSSKAHVSVLTTVLEDPAHYGRIVRDGTSVKAIVEEKDATEEEKNIKEINTGICCFKAEILKKFLPLLEKNNVQGELYLTDVVGLAVDDG